MKIKVCAIQCTQRLGDKAWSTDHLFSMAQDAAAMGANIIVGPETATTGYCWKNGTDALAAAEAIPDGGTVRRAESFCAAHGTVLIFGMIERQGNNLYNSLVAVGPAGFLGSYRKLHLFPTDCAWATPGNLEIPVFETPFGRIGAGICLDALYPEHARVCALKGAQLLCYCSQWPTQQGPDPAWFSCAYDNGLPMVVANRVGTEAGLFYRGGSVVLNADGSVQATCLDQEGLVFGEVELPERPLAASCPARRPDLYLGLQRSNYLWDAGIQQNWFAPTLPEGGRLPVTVVQRQGAPGDLSQNLSVFLSEVEKQTQPGGLIVFPAYFLTGRPRSRSQAGQYAVPLSSPEISLIQEACKTAGIHAVLGAAVQHDSTTFYNAALVIGNDGSLTPVYQSHLEPDDLSWATPGDEPPKGISLSNLRLSVLLGEELHIPELARLAAMEAADVLCIIGDGLFPGRAVEQCPGLFWHRARCRQSENNTVVAYADTQGYSGIFVPPAFGSPASELILTPGQQRGTLEIDTRYCLPDHSPNPIRQKQTLRMRRPGFYQPIWAAPSEGGL